MDIITKKLLRSAYDENLLTDQDTMNQIVDDIIDGVQYFTADDIVNMLIEHIYIPEEGDND